MKKLIVLAKYGRTLNPDEYKFWRVWREDRIYRIWENQALSLEGKSNKASKLAVKI